MKTAPVHNEKNMNADTKFHLAHIQVFFIIRKSCWGKHKLLYVFGKKKKIKELPGV